MIPSIPPLPVALKERVEQLVTVCDFTPQDFTKSDKCALYHFSAFALEGVRRLVRTLPEEQRKLLRAPGPNDSTIDWSVTVVLDACFLLAVPAIPQEDAKAS